MYLHRYHCAILGAMSTFLPQFGTSCWDLGSPSLMSWRNEHWSSSRIQHLHVWRLTPHRRQPRLCHFWCPRRTWCSWGRRASPTRDASTPSHRSSHSRTPRNTKARLRPSCSRVGWWSGILQHLPCPKSVAWPWSRAACRAAKRTTSSWWRPRSKC